MKQLNKNNYKRFLSYYNDFCEACIKQIDYNSEKSEIQVIFCIAKPEKTLLENSNILRENPVNLKMTFKGIDNFSTNSPYEIDYIDYTYMDFYSQNGKNLICFALNNEDPDIEPYLYIACESIEYEEIE